MLHGFNMPGGCDMLDGCDMLHGLDILTFANDGEAAMVTRRMLIADNLTTFIGPPLRTSM
jgi:hypothetical protein